VTGADSHGAHGVRVVRVLSMLLIVYRLRAFAGPRMTW
jgi:hypothetical protein